MNLLEIIIRENQSDCCDTDKESERLKSYYEEATHVQKEAIDRILIAICGWSFETLLKMEKEED